jgi:glucose/arabinose dehydrogenase
LCTGSLLAIPPGGGEPTLLAWGLRNPFGMAFAPDGALYVTDNGYDDRGSRPVWGSPDVLWRIEPGTWYGWPDYVAGRPITNEEFDPPGKDAPQPLLAEDPGQPPEPVAEFECHSSADGFDFSRNESFGHVGEAFVALFGDQSPGTGKLLGPVGFKVVRVDVTNGTIEDFAVNRGRENGPASKLDRGGLERPVAARFTPDGQALYVVDFGVLTQDGATAQPRRETGVLWRITRTEDLVAHEMATAGAAAAQEGRAP